jgi:CBS domain-containing protein
MGLLEQKNFIKGIVPFDTLSNYNLETLTQELDIAYFKEDETILSTINKPEYLYFIIKGVVQEIDEDEVLSVFSNNDYFDPISLIENKTKHNFIAKQETICYLLRRELFLNLIYENEELESFFFQSISKKLNTNTQNTHNKEFVNFMISRVKDAYLQQPIVLDDNQTIFNAVSILKQNKGSSLLVKNTQGDLGIVTDTDFREKIILNRLSFDDKISKIATYGLKTVSSEEFLFNAQLKMNKYGIKRLIVKDENTNEIIGVLDLISLTSFFASHTYSLMMELDNTTSIEELKVASEKFVRVIRTLFAKGVKVRYISKVISQLNNKLFGKLFEILASVELKNQSALIIMGSEGRGEQILRTDQDNALILTNDCSVPQETIERFTNDFTKYLIDFGYPRCDGDIMVSNPFWVKSAKDFEKTIFDWVNHPSEHNHMSLAIFYDALCVAGNKNLLIDVKGYLYKKLTDSQSFHSQFAKAVLSFETPLNLFANFIVDKKEHKDELDIKKGGIFPIVHGVRSLALEKCINRTNTVHRLKELNNMGVIDREFTSELIESFTFLLSLRLKFRLEKIDCMVELDNYVNPSKLNTLEKDLLRDSFKIVDKFKKFLTYHYKLNMI